MSTAPILSTERASFRYPGRSADIGPFDAAIRAGELHLFSGRSGCGKSTLARILSGLIPHLYRGQLAGRVLVGGQRTCDIPVWQLANRVGLVTQNPAAQLLASTVRGEIVFGLENLGLPAREIEARGRTVLAVFGLQALAERNPQTLSGGEQQKLVLAAIAARRPDALVLDEPLSMLDAASARAIVGYLDGLRNAGTAVVAFEHRCSAFAHLTDVHRYELPKAAADMPELVDMKTSLPAFRVLVEHLGVALGGARVLDGLDLALTGGQVLAVVGPNGAGKTTLLRALCGLQVYTGRINVSLGGSNALPRLGLCFQNPDRQLFNPTVRAEILFGHPHHEERRYRNVLELLDLSRHEDTPPLLLSEGEKKRLALAIMLLQPGLCGVCLDEPTLGQDPDNCRLLGRIVRLLANAGYLCVVATHDMDWAHTWSDQLLVLRNGRLSASVSPQPIGHHSTRQMQAERLPLRALATSCEGTGSHP